MSMRRRTAQVDPDYIFERLRVIGIRDMFDCFIVIAPADVADELEAIYQEKGEVLYPWPNRAERRCIRYRVTFEPQGGYFAKDSKDTKDRDRALQDAVKLVRDRLGLFEDTRFLGGGI